MRYGRGVEEDHGDVTVMSPIAFDFTTWLRKELRSLSPLPSRPGIRRLTVTSLLRSMTPGMFRTTSANQILRGLRGLGMGVRRQWLLQQVRWYAAEEERSARYWKADYDALVHFEPKDLSPVQLSTEYSYQLSMEVTGYPPGYERIDVSQDEIRTQFYWYGSDKLMTPREIEASFAAKFRDTTMKDVKADWETLRFEKASFRGKTI